MKPILFYRKRILLILMLISVFKLLYFTYSGLSLFTEETQYWLWSKHLDWNYYSKPLMVALFNYLSTAAFGDTEFAVKLNAILLSFGTAWVVFEFTYELFKNPKSAFYASLMLIVMPFYHLGSIFHTTDSSLYFFWILAFYWLWKAWMTNQLKWWTWAALATALGILSKNIMVLVIPVMALFILLNQPKRLFQKEFVLYCLFSALAFIPILYWNLQHDFVTFKHVGTLGGVEGKQKGFDLIRSLKYMGEYIGGQLGFLSPFFLPLLVLAFKDLRKKGGERLQFLMLPVMTVWALFLAMSVFKNVNVNWPAFGMLTLPITMVYVLEQRSKSWNRYFHVSALVTGSLLLLLFFPQPLDALGFKKILKPSKDPMGRLAGYREMGERIDLLKDSLQLNAHFIFSDSYHLSSEMAFYVKGNPQTYNINLGRRQNQFDLWPGIGQFEGKGYAGIYITREPAVQQAVADGFDKVLLAEKFYTVHRGDTIKTYIIQVLGEFQQIVELRTEDY